MGPTSASWFSPRFAALGAAACLLLALPGCQDKSPADLLGSAARHLEQGDPRSATIELKQVLQQDLQSRPARLLLGRLLLQADEPAAAVVELRKALGDDPADPQVLPLLARALLASGAGAELIERHAGTVLAPAAAQADLQAQLAAAHAAAGRVERAQQLVDEALRAAPDSAPARLVQARLLARARDLGGALAGVEAVVAREPANAEAWQMLGDLRLLQAGDPAPAVEAYRRALALSPSSLPLHASLTAALLQAGQLEPAAAELAALRARHPDSARGQLLQAQLALERQDLKGARATTERLLKEAPRNPRLLELAGVIESREGALAAAERYLGQALQQEPGRPLARRELAQTQLRLGQPARTLAVLQPLLQQPEPPLFALALAGQAQMMLGQGAAAQALFERAARLQPGHGGLRTGLAMARLAQRDDAQALAELQTLAAQDAGPAADLALINAHLQRRRPDAALQALQRLEAKTPGQPLPALLRGRVLLDQGQAAPARAAFEQALQRDAVYFPAIASLAALDVREGRPELARQRLLDLLKAQPAHYAGLLALAELQVQAGDPVDDTAERLRSAIRLRPQEAAPRVQLVNLLLQARQARPALSAAEDASASLPGDAQVLEVLGRAQLASGTAQQAAASFGRLAAMQPRAAAPLVLLAQTQIVQKQPAAALDSVQRALKLQPDSLAAQRALIMLRLDAGDGAAALAAARTVQRQRPQQAVGWVLEGDIAVARRQWPAAAVAYRQALRVAPAPEVAIKLHTALLSQDQPAEAARLATSWMAAHPRDAALPSHLGEQALARREWDSAQDHFTRALQANPQAVSALNNLAWLLASQRRPGALAHAERAQRLQPRNPAVLDTLALALAAEGQLPRALQVQQQALALAPDNPLLQYDLARLYLQAGDGEQARQHLQAVAQAGPRFKDQAEVKALLASL